MAAEVGKDNLAVINIEGMHCHRCEQTIQKALAILPGVFEVEVDFPSRQASVLFDGHLITVPELLETIKRTGYRAVGFKKCDLTTPPQ